MPTILEGALKEKTGIISGKKVVANKMGNPGKNSAQLFKQRQSGGLYFSRDPLNLVNKHSRKVRLSTQYNRS